MFTTANLQLTRSKLRLWRIRYSSRSISRLQWWEPATMGLTGSKVARFSLAIPQKEFIIIFIISFYCRQMTTWSLMLRDSLNYCLKIEPLELLKLSNYNYGQNVWDKLWFSCEIAYYAKSSISIFKESFASIEKTFFLGGRLDARL